MTYTRPGIGPVWIPLGQGLETLGKAGIHTVTPKAMPLKPPKPVGRKNDYFLQKIIDFCKKSSILRLFTVRGFQKHDIFHTLPFCPVLETPQIIDPRSPGSQKHAIFDQNRPIFYQFGVPSTKTSHRQEYGDGFEMPFFTKKHRFLQNLSKFFNNFYKNL